MLGKIIEMYSQYRMRYDPLNKILFIYTPMLVVDYVNLKLLLKIHKIDVKDIRIMGGNI